MKSKEHVVQSHTALRCNCALSAFYQCFSRHATRSVSFRHLFFPTIGKIDAQIASIYFMAVEITLALNAVAPSQYSQNPYPFGFPVSRSVMSLPTGMIVWHCRLRLLPEIRHWTHFGKDVFQHLPSHRMEYCPLLDKSSSKCLDSKDVPKTLRSFCCSRHAR